MAYCTSEAHFRIGANVKGQKIAIVIGVGAESGIGGAMCLRAAKAGHHVIVCGRTQAKLDRVASTINAGGGTASSCVADVTQESQVEAGQA